MGVRRGALVIRMLKLLRELDAGWRDAERLALLFQVSTKTVIQDVKSLRAAGFIIDEEPWFSEGRGRRRWRLQAWPEAYDLTGAMQVRPVKQEIA